METEDFGFHDYQSAMLHGDWLVLSGFRVFPQPGGLNDQFVTDTEDLLTYLRGLAWARNLNKENGRKPDDVGEQELGEIHGEGIKEIDDWKAFL